MTVDGAIWRDQLTAAERTAFTSQDFKWLYDHGVNPYLLYFCALQLGVDRAAYYATIRGETPEVAAHG